MGEMRQFTTCTCPFCKSNFALEVTINSIEVKTFSGEQQINNQTEDKTENIK